MKKYLTAFSFCLLLAVTALPAYADDDGALKTAIEKRYSDLRLAIKKGDPAVYRAILAADFSSIDLGDTARDADQVIEVLGKTVPDNTRRENTTVTSLKQDGDKAVVDQTYDMTALRVGQDNSKINYHMVTKSTDTWVKIDDAWLLQKTITNSGDIFINDKPAAHYVRGETAKPAAATADKPVEKKPTPAK